MPYVDANAFNMADYALNSNDPLVKETYWTMIGASSLFTYLPVITDKSLKQTGTRITGDLPKPTWTNINSDPTIKSSPDPEWFEESIYVHRDGVQVDYMYLEDKNSITDPFEARVKGLIEGTAYDLNYKFIQNKHTGITTDPRRDPLAFVGLRERLDHPEKYFTSPQCLIDAGGVDLSSAGAGTDGIQLEYLLEQLLYEMGAPDGTDVTVAMNGRAMRSINRAVKKAGSGAGFNLGKDNYDRTVTKFKNAVIIDCGRNGATGPKTARIQAPIISETETADGSADTGGTFTSIYAFRTGRDHLFGWQFEPMKPSDPYLLPNGVTFQVNINHALGIMQPDPRAVGRVFNVKLA